MLSIVVAPVCIPTNSALGLPILKSLPALVVDLLMMIILTGVKWNLLIASDVEYPFICLLTLRMSSSEKCLFRSFAYFLTVFLSSWCRVVWVFYILWRSNPCLRYHLQIYFPIWFVPFSFCWCFLFSNFQIIIFSKYFEYM